MSLEYEQIKTAMAEGHARTPRSLGPPQEAGYLEALRRLCVQSVYAVWNRSQREAELMEIFVAVRRTLEHYRPVRGVPHWRPDWKIPSKRTVDRRVNEAADARFYPGITPVVGVRPGLYLPNPRAFDGETRDRIEQIILSASSAKTSLSLVAE